MILIMNLLQLISIMIVLIKNESTAESLGVVLEKAVINLFISM